MKIIVAKLGTARGKVRKIFLKRFLEQTDFNYIICQTQEEVKKNIEKNDAVICLYNEDRNSNLKEKFGFLDEYTDIIVFNDYKTGEIIADKSRTNCVLTKHGVLMPEEIKSSIASKDCLSLSKTGSGKQIQVIKKDDRLDPNRYNVEFINTKIVYDQKSYYTAVRLWCIGKELLFPVVRSRLIEEGPSVHDSNTYINIDFLTYLQESLIIPNIEKFEKIAEEIEKVFGLGFYVYDLVIDTKTKEIFVCEVGYKFQDYVCQKRFRKIIKHLPFYQALEKSRFLNLMQKLLFLNIQEL